MNIPEAFYQFSGSLYPGSADQYATEDEWIAAALGWRRPEDRMAIKRFLDQLLDGRHSEAELSAVWGSTGPVYNFRPGGHRRFFTRIRDLIK